MRARARWSKRKGEERFEGTTPPGSAPGMLVAPADAPMPTVRMIAYGPDGIDEKRVGNLDEVRRTLERRSVTWLDVVGLGSAEMIRKIGAMFDLHPLALEDVLHVHQRAKVEHYGEHLFLVCRMPSSGVEYLETEQLGIFLGKNFVVSFQEREGDCLDPVRERLRHGRGRIRSEGPDYLAYALVDAVIDAYFPVTEGFGDRIDALEEEVLGRPGREVLGRIHALQRDLIALRRVLWPHRDAVQALSRESGAIVDEGTRVFLRDAFDHTVRLIEIVEHDRELAAQLRDLHLSLLSHRMNEVMRVLTVIATLFIPLTFVAGVYGMNFDPSVSPWNMPELRWAFGYPLALLMMAGMAGALLLYFRRKGWISGRGTVAAAPHAPGREHERPRSRPS